MTNISPRSEELERARSNYKLESEPYIKLLIKIQIYKKPRVVLNKITQEITMDYGEDTNLEIEIKKILESLKEKYLILFK